MSTILHLTVASAKPVLRGNDHYWSVMMTHHDRRQPFSVADIDKASNGHTADVKKLVRQLVAAGVLGRADAKGASEQLYRVLKPQTATPQISRSGKLIETMGKTQAMWLAMRSGVCGDGFTMHTIASLVKEGSDGEIRISRETAKAYIQRLHEAGFLVEKQKGGARHPTVWRLLPDMNSGPFAPKILRSHLVWDPNRKQVVGAAVAEEIAS